MNVVLVSDNLQVGGAHVYAVQLANSLAERGIEVTLAYGRYAENPLEARLAEGVRRLPLGLRPTLSAVEKANHVANTLRAIRTLKGELRIRTRAVVHTFFAASGLPAWIAATHAGVPVVNTPMATSVATNLLTKKLYKTNYIKKAVSINIALSDYIKNDIIKEFSIDKRKIVTVRLGVDVRRHHPAHLSLAERTAQLAGFFIPEVKLWAGLVARLDPAKCVDLAVRAVAAADEGVHLAIVGDGPELEPLRRLAARLGAENRIHFVGRQLDVRPFMRAFDVYLQTTRGPNLGLSALEALASGVPLLIAARDADEREMAADTVLGRGGQIADATSQALAGSLDTLMREPDNVRQSARDEARQLAVERYDWEGHVDGVVQVYVGLAQS